jgi:hypothetical protein
MGSNIQASQLRQTQLQYDANSQSLGVPLWNIKKRKHFQEHEIALGKISPRNRDSTTPLRDYAALVPYKSELTLTESLGVLAHAHHITARKEHKSLGQSINFIVQADL